MLDPLAVQLFSKLVKEVDADVILSSTWRKHFNIEEFNKCIASVGGTFKIISRTSWDDCRIRGVEIHQWLEKNVEERDFNKYVILDDDSDMLLNQRNNFFHVDGYCGLTPNICYKVKRFLLENKRGF